MVHIINFLKKIKSLQIRKQIKIIYIIYFILRIFLIYEVNKLNKSGKKIYKEKYIGGDFFESLADEENIYYIITDNIRLAFYRNTSSKILITHDSDINIGNELFLEFKKCGKYKYWFAMNTAIVNERIITVPIGLDMKRWASVPKYEIIMQEKKKNIKPNKLLFACFSINSNKKKRMDCINSLKNKKYLTDKVSYSINKEERYTVEGFRKFVDDILEHKFILCPEGKGIDTHRFWEVLYLERFPVVLHNPVTDSFSDMPVLILNRWTDFEIEYSNFLKRVENKEFNYNKLNPDYWRKLTQKLIK